MKTYKDIYKFPLRKNTYGTWVYDQESNFVFQFEPKYSNGEYAEGWIDFEKKVLQTLNGCHEKFEGKFTAKNGEIFYNDLHVITIRGWGNLTGTGARNLPAEVAANIQDTFCDFIVNTLNNAVEPT